MLRCDEMMMRVFHLEQNPISYVTLVMLQGKYKMFPLDETMSDMTWHGMCHDIIIVIVVILWLERRLKRGRKLHKRTELNLRKARWENKDSTSSLVSCVYVEVWMKWWDLLILYVPWTFFSFLFSRYKLVHQNTICNIRSQKENDTNKKSKHIRSDITINHITTTTTAVSRRERTGRLLLLYAINVTHCCLLNMVVVTRCVTIMDLHIQEKWVLLKNPYLYTSAHFYFLFLFYPFNITGSGRVSV